MCVSNDSNIRSMFQTRSGPVFADNTIGDVTADAR